MTKDGPRNPGQSPGQENKPCMFPWYYSKDTVPKLYAACASPDGDPRNWCPTELTDGKYISGSGKWGYCNEDVPACKIKGEVKPLRLSGLLGQFLSGIVSQNKINSECCSCIFFPIDLS